MTLSGNIRYRLLKDRLFKIGIVLLSGISILPLLFIFIYIFKNGISGINLDFLTNLPKPVGETGGGISNAILGTVILIVLSCILAIPLGVGAGILLSERRKGKLASTVRLSVEVLQGVPSIVLGIIAYAWVVLPMGRFSALAGAVALAIMMLPMIVRTTEETLKLIPENLKEAALALGAPYHITILKIILPAGLSGILTGILVSVARIAGETAPLLFTAFGTPFMDLNILKPVNSLPLLIFNYATSPYPDWQKAAWGASLVLIVMVLLLNVIAKLVAKRWKVEF
jgi:phosphate transport system permease protein